MMYKEVHWIIITRLEGQRLVSPQVVVQTSATAAILLY